MSRHWRKRGLRDKAPSTLWRDVAGLIAVLLVIAAFCIVGPEARP